MRHVMVWFTCSVKGCDARAEHLVRCRQQGFNWSTCAVSSDDLPEGWGRDKVDDFYVNNEDYEGTYCPEHARKR